MSFYFTLKWHYTVSAQNCESKSFNTCFPNTTLFINTRRLRETVKLQYTH